jgi:hypothetical protein
LEDHRRARIRPERSVQETLVTRTKVVFWITQGEIL